MTNNVSTHIGELLTFTTGLNISRLKKGDYTEDQLYTVSNIDEDLAMLKKTKPDVLPIQSDFATKKNDLIISMIRQKATVVTTNTNKILSSNFVKAVYDSSILDAWFLCYWFNESDEAKKQKHTSNKLFAYYTSSTMSDLEITLPCIEKQREIGKSYQAINRMQYLMEQQKNDWTKLALEIIRHSLNKNDFKGVK